MKTNQIVRELKRGDEDFEWYPTTPSIIKTIQQDMREELLLSSPSILDCGAGDGRVLMALTDGKRYAIEKSQKLIGEMDRDICIVGTEFHEQTLLDKEVDVVFCNPPYSQFEAWMEKIIVEGFAMALYFVVPRRWTESKKIANALEQRSADVKTLGSFDFSSGERPARALVDVLRVDLCVYKGHGRHYRMNTNPFDTWFSATFPGFNELEKESVKKDESLRSQVRKEVVQGGDIVCTLEKLYQCEMSRLLQNYQLLEQMDPTLLKELGVKVRDLKEALNQKISGVKTKYWRELFHNLSSITDRLTMSSREGILGKLTAQTNLEFTIENVRAVVVWVLKNANHYYDAQLIELVERMVTRANFKKYVSNQRTFDQEDWKYRQAPEGLDRYFLEYRFILENMGGVCSEPYYSHKKEKYNGLSEYAHNFVSDIITVAGNLGFNIEDTGRVNSDPWEAGKAQTFDFFDNQTQDHVTLIAVRAHKNGNLHLKFNQEFMKRLNIEFGRLKGWLKNHQEAAHEMNIAPAEAGCAYGCNAQIGVSSYPQLEFQEVEVL